MIKIASALVCAVVGVKGAYDYKLQGADWSTIGETNFQATCVPGTTYHNQSPIDITTTTTDLADIIIENNYDAGKYSSYTVAQDTHDLVITPIKAATTDPSSNIVVTSITNVTDTTFNLVNYTIKTKAEHKLGGTQNAMEIQAKYTDAAKATNHLTMSFIYKSSAAAAATDYPALNAISKVTPAYTGGVEKSATQTDSMYNLMTNLWTQAAKTQPKVFTYAGSSTNPDCAEGVTWIVVGDALDMASSIIDYMVVATKTADDLGNYRETVGGGKIPANSPVPAVTYLPAFGASNQVTYSLATVAALFVAYFSV